MAAHADPFWNRHTLRAHPVEVCGLASHQRQPGSRAIFVEDDRLRTAAQRGFRARNRYASGPPQICTTNVINGVHHWSPLALPAASGMFDSRRIR